MSSLKRHRATQRAIDKQIGGTHYKGKIQPIELIVSHNLDFIDGNRKNHKHENLRMLCFNCSFLINGNLTGPKKEYEY